ncbi:hypothetical protein SF23_03510 [Streptomyces sp. MBRL 10]|nr:hypothetical protein SF23_03510 [Streptomyces sp. MBRL 10]
MASTMTGTRSPRRSLIAATVRTSREMSDEALVFTKWNGPRVSRNSSTSRLRSSTWETGSEAGAAPLTVPGPGPGTSSVPGRPRRLPSRSSSAVSTRQCRLLPPGSA